MAGTLIKLLLTGRSPLIMHAPTLVNPLHPLKKDMDALMSAKRKKGADKDAVFEKLAAVEFRAGLYYDDVMGPYVPADAIQKCIQEGAKLGKKGKEIERGLVVLGAKNRLEYAGPRTMDELLLDKTFWDIRPVVVQRQRIMRTRPIFNEWSVTVELSFDTRVITRDSLLEYVEDAGMYCGLLDGRSKSMGRFEVKVIEDAKTQKAK